LVAFGRTDTTGAGALVTCGWAHGKGVAATVAAKARATIEMCMVIGFVDGIFGD
jgi:hypothetical protein